MRFAVLLPAGFIALAALTASCSRDLSGKTRCNAETDCITGFTCVSNQCAPDKGAAGTMGGGGNSGNGGNGGVGPFDGGFDGVARMCPTSPVNACPAEDSGSRCEQTYCGGRIWQNSLTNSVLVNYRILDPTGAFSTSYKAAIRASASAWSRASAKFVTIKECAVCSGKFISVVPGDGDGVINPDEPEQRLPMPVDSGGRISPHRIAHQWGHVLGLSHTYERADRDRYMGFDPDVWCAAGSSGLPPRCAAGSADLPGFPAITTGTFGAFDGKSKMNGLGREGVCGTEEPDEDSGEPTIGDVSALAELFSGVYFAWSPFQPIGRSVSPTQPLDYQLAPGVDPSGSPQIVEAVYASPEIFVRGTDNRVYTTTRRDLVSATTAQWNDWTPVAEDVDADPGVVFSRNATSDTLILAVRSRVDGQIHLSSRSGGGWGQWTSIGAPPTGAASAPALASQSPKNLAVLVRGGDGLIYRLPCTDADADSVCGPSAARANAWMPLPAPPSPSAIFVGKPSAFWALDNTKLTVAAVSDDRAVMLMTDVEAGGGAWDRVPTISNDLAPDDLDPGVAIAPSSTPGFVAFFARNQQRLLVSDFFSTTFPSIGGILASPPSVATFIQNGMRTEIAAIIDDHGRPGVWWRYNQNVSLFPCYYNRPGTCMECGL
jgi:hypothetical protein